MSAEPTDADASESARFAVVSEPAGPLPLSTCATCRRPLIERGGGAVCAYCLAGFLAGEDDEFPEGGEADDKNNARAERYGQFEICIDAAGSPVELGRGAMGIAYRARDTVLDRTVALKVIDLASPNIRPPVRGSCAKHRRPPGSTIPTSLPFCTTAKRLENASTSWNSWPARRSPSACAGTVRSPPRWRWKSRCRSRTLWRRRKRKASCTATSSRATSCWTLPRAANTGRQRRR